MVGISTKQRSGIDELLELVLLQAEIMELKANPNKPARGRVIEAKLDKGRGPVATILIQGRDPAGQERRIRLRCLLGACATSLAMSGKSFQVAGPSMPVEVLGLRSAQCGG